MALIKPTETFGNRDTPSVEPKEQYLFLLEFFVFRIMAERLAKLNRMFFVPTRVSFKFMDSDDENISMTQVDPMFNPLSCVANSVEHFNSGRSVMFAIARHLVSKKDMNFAIKILVEKKMQMNVKPDIVVGIGELDMSTHFAALRKEILQCSYTNYPPPKIFEGNVDLFFEDELVGNISIYVRISGFGQSIETEIETPVPEKKSSTYVFKSQEQNDTQLAYKCRMIDSKTTNICQDPERDLSEAERCLILWPKTHNCTPCSSKGASEKPISNIQGHAGLWNKPEDNCEAPLKSVLCGKPITGQWNCKTLSNVTQSCEQIRTIHRLKEETRLRDLPIQSSRGPSEPCGRAVVLKVSGLLDVEDPDGKRKKQPTVTVTSKSESGSLEVHPKHDVFILRIGKKGLVGAGEKSDIQLEMRTPKRPESRPPIRYETREIQTNEESSEKGSSKKYKTSTDKKKKKK